MKKNDFPLVPFRARTYRHLALLGHFAFAGLAVYFLVVGNRLGAGVMGLFFLLSLAYHFSEERLPSLFDLLILLTGLVNAFGWAIDLYSLDHPWFDQVAHGLTTGTVALVVYQVVYRGELRGELIRRPLTLAFTFTVLGLGLGAAWELFERVLDLTLGLGLQHGLEDTLLDLLADLVGTLLGLGLVLLHRKHLGREPDHGQVQQG